MKKLPALLIAIASYCTGVTAQTTVTLRPHFNGQESGLAMLDSTCSSWSSNAKKHYIDSNFSYTNLINTLAWTASSCKLYSRYITRFAGLSDTSVITAGSTILNAKLYLYGIPSDPTGNYGNSYYPGSPYNSSGTNEGWVYELAAPFSPTTVTWRTQPAVLHTDSVLVPVSTAHWGGNDTLDVTSIVAHLYATGNKGMLIKLATENTYRQHLYGSSRYSDSNYHPALRVTYLNTAAVASVNNSLATLTLAPNPATSVLNAEIIASENTEMSVTVFNAVGTREYTATISVHKGANNTSIPINALSPGIYILEARNGNTQLKQRFVKY